MLIYPTLLWSIVISSGWLFLLSIVGERSLRYWSHFESSNSQHSLFFTIQSYHGHQILMKPSWVCTKVLLTSEHIVAFFKSQYTYCLAFQSKYVCSQTQFLMVLGWHVKNLEQLKQKWLPKFNLLVSALTEWALVNLSDGSRYKKSWSALPRKYLASCSKHPP